MVQRLGRDTGRPAEAVHGRQETAWELQSLDNSASQGAQDGLLSSASLPLHGVRVRVDTQMKAQAV